MLGLGQGIGAGIKVAGSVIGGLSAARAARKQRANYARQINDNNNFLARKLNEDATQRADAQSVITQMKEALQSQNRAQRGMNAVMGSSGEAVAAQKQANANAIADTMGGINAAAVAQKNALEQQVRAQNAGLNDKIANTYASQAQAISQAAEGVGKVGSDIFNLYSDEKK